MFAQVTNDSSHLKTNFVGNFLIKFCRDIQNCKKVVAAISFESSNLETCLICKTSNYCGLVHEVFRWYSILVITSPQLPNSIEAFYKYIGKKSTAIN